MAAMGDNETMTSIDLAAARSHLQLPAHIRSAITAASSDQLAGITPGDALFTQAASWLERQHGWQAPIADAIFLPKTTQLTTALLNAGRTCYDPPAPDSAVPGMPMDAASAMDMGAPLPVISQLAAAEAKQREADADNPGTPRPPVVVALSPTYGRVAEMVRKSGAQLRLVRMQDFGGRLRINWPALENAMIGADYLLWTNPHNPTGRAWSVEEMQRVGYLAEIYRTTVLSDDIHADYATGSYTPLAKACPGLYARGLLAEVHSPTITFPMSGMQAAVVFATGEIAAQLREAKARLSLRDASPLVVAAAIAAWSEASTDAVTELNDLVSANREFATEFLRRELPNWQVSASDGTCLLWVDTTADATPLAATARELGVHISPGGSFGESWSTWMRLSIALPQSELATGLERLVGAAKK